MSRLGVRAGAGVRGRAAEARAEREARGEVRYELGHRRGLALPPLRLELYETLQDFDGDVVAAKALTMPRLAFAGSEDEIAYGPGWGDTVVRVAAPLRRRGDELRAAGWDVEPLPGLDHLTTMQSAHVLPLLGPWLGRCLPG